MVIQVTAPHFVAGIVLRRGRCVQAPPILAWCVGWAEEGLRAYFARKGWRVFLLET